MAHGADVHRAEQDPHARLSARRAHGPADVRRGDLLLLIGEVPSPCIGRLMEAMLVSFIDHGATPPSTLAARNTATTGAPLRACVAAGVLGFGRYHGGDIESCMQFLDSGLELVREGRVAIAMPPRSIVQQVPRPAKCRRDSAIASTRAIRARRGCSRWRSSSRSKAEHIQMIRAVEKLRCATTRSRRTRRAGQHRRCDRRRLRRPGMPPTIANALFIISRVPGIAAHADEERQRQQPMREIDPKEHRYDGPSARRLPERRK